MTLRMRAAVQRRDFAIDLELGAHERIAVLGPNGAGKSTLLNLVAGIVRPDTGRAELHGRVLFQLEPGVRRWVPPHARGVALLAQDPLLFPHLSVLDNVGFGPRAAGQSRAAARATAHRWLTEVGAGEFANRSPAHLSGGQAQRVAIARALAAEPRLLLLDEPMGALDIGAAPLLRRVLRRVLADRGAIIVTHDLLDALLLAQRVVVLDHGRIVESGPVAEVIKHPRTPFTARIAGLNLVLGRTEDGGLRGLDGTHVEGLFRAEMVRGEAAVAVFSPSAVAVYDQLPHGSPRNTIPVTLADLEPRGDQVRVRATTASGQTLVADVTAPAVGELDLYPGKSCTYAVKATAVTIYPA